MGEQYWTSLNVHGSRPKIINGLLLVFATQVVLTILVLNQYGARILSKDVPNIGVDYILSLNSSIQPQNGANYSRRTQVKKITTTSELKSVKNDVIVTLIPSIHVEPSAASIHVEPRATSIHVEPRAGLLKKLKDDAKTVIPPHFAERKHSGSDGTKPLLTLVTTWCLQCNRNKTGIYNNTLRNWSQLGPRVNLVLYSNDTGELREWAIKYGWNILPVTRYAYNGIPILKYMMLETKSLFNSSLYTYANGDIIFGDSLLDTLRFLVSSEEFAVTPSLAIGTRVNVIGVNSSNTATLDDVEIIAREKGENFWISALDYFVVSPYFPWENIPEFIVGKPGYDNWIVSYSLRHNKVNIDVSNTVLAVHQTDIGGNQEGKTSVHSTYNLDLVGRLDLIPHYTGGVNICAPRYTFFSRTGKMTVGKRKKLDKRCPGAI